MLEWLYENKQHSSRLQRFSFPARNHQPCDVAICYSGPLLDHPVIVLPELRATIAHRTNVRLCGAQWSQAGVANCEAKNSTMPIIVRGNVPATSNRDVPFARHAQMLTGSLER